MSSTDLHHRANPKVTFDNWKHKIFLAITFLTIMFISVLTHRHFTQGSPAKVCLSELTGKPDVKSIRGITLFEDELLILNEVSQMIHTVTLNHTNFASSAKMSRATIINPRKKYCTGDKLIIQIDMFDYLGNRKTYGGDFIKPRIFNSKLNAGASGVVEDFNNGTYHVHFTLFWEGKVYSSLLLYHSSEAVSAIWRARDNDYNFINFVGTFVNRNQSVKSECGFKLDSAKEVCEYGSIKYSESFYCIKQDNFHCGSLSFLQSSNSNISFLRSMEKPLFNRENVAINIQRDFDYIDVSKCTDPAPLNLSTCRIGMKSPLPSGFAFRNKWQPSFCNIPDFSTEDKMYACLQNKLIYFLGDSTVRQWFEYLVKTLKEWMQPDVLFKWNRFPPVLRSSSRSQNRKGKRRCDKFKNFDLYRAGNPLKFFAAHDKKNTLLFFKKHSHPFVTARSYVVKDEFYMSDEIDHLEGGPHHVLILSLGQHFRPFPIQLFIRRVFNVHRAVERLFIRSPDTKVIIKTENTREIQDAERSSDFHGYIQYLIVKEVFKDLPVSTVDAWDMTVAFNTDMGHPPVTVVRNQIYMFFSYICS